MRVSIIIPCSEIDTYVEECIEHCGQLDYEDFEIILLPDNPLRDLRFDGIKIVPTGAVPPGKKRNIGIENSNGELLAFIDSDAYPRKDWLKNAAKYFNDSEIAAVGGPGLTPEKDSSLQKASGYVLSSPMVGALSNRYRAGKAYESDDIHSCNFIAEREVIEKIRWDEKYWPGEDTLVCLGIKKLGKKMIEAPDVVVYHHRKPLLIPHLKQVSNFGLHRGFFAKRFPDTSLRAVYFAPSLFILFLLFAASLSLIYPPLLPFYLFAITTYLIAAFISSMKEPKLAPFIWAGIILTHLTYGLFFLIGLLRSELRR